MMPAENDDERQMSRVACCTPQGELDRQAARRHEADLLELVATIRIPRPDDDAGEPRAASEEMRQWIPQ